MGKIIDAGKQASIRYKIEHGDSSGGIAGGPKIKIKTPEKQPEIGQDNNIVADSIDLSSLSSVSDTIKKLAAEQGPKADTSSQVKPQEVDLVAKYSNTLSSVLMIAGNNTTELYQKADAQGKQALSGQIQQISGAIDYLTQKKNILDVKGQKPSFSAEENEMLKNATTIAFNNTQILAQMDPANRDKYAKELQFLGGAFKEAQSYDPQKIIAQQNKAETQIPTDKSFIEDLGLNYVPTYFSPGTTGMPTAATQTGPVQPQPQPMPQPAGQQNYSSMFPNITQYTGDPQLDGMLAQLNAQVAMPGNAAGIGNISYPGSQGVSPNQTPRGMDSPLINPQVVNNLLAPDPIVNSMVQPAPYLPGGMYSGTFPWNTRMSFPTWNTGVMDPMSFGMYLNSTRMQAPFNAMMYGGYNPVTQGMYNPMNPMMNPMFNPMMNPMNPMANPMTMMNMGLYNPMMMGMGMMNPMMMGMGMMNPMMMGMMNPMMSAGMGAGALGMGMSMHNPWMGGMGGGMLGSGLGSMFGGMLGSSFGPLGMMGGSMLGSIGGGLLGSYLGSEASGGWMF